MFGDAQKGNPIPYIPGHQFYIQQGVVWQRWPGYLSVNYIDEVCAFASCGPFEQTDSLTTIDASVHYDLTPRIQIFGLAKELGQSEKFLVLLERE